MMTNPLLKVTLILLSLVSAVLFGQAVLSPAQNEPVSSHALVIETTTSQDSTSAMTPQARLTVETAGDKSASSPAKSSTPERSSHRSFSFHYLDILEWMFGGRGEKARQRQSQRPSASLSAW